MPFKFNTGLILFFTSALCAVLLFFQNCNRFQVETKTQTSATPVTNTLPTINSPNLNTTTSHKDIFALGDGSTCFIGSAGKLQCCGFNYLKLLGDDSSELSKQSPVDIDQGTSYSIISKSSSTTCAITNTGVLKCWGWNSEGQIGDGSVDHKSNPTIIDSRTTYSSVSAGREHTCAITTLGTLKCWGSNQSGKIGDGTIGKTTTSGSTIEFRKTPVTIDSSTNYKSVFAGWQTTCGITKDGVLKCWGNLGGGSDLISTPLIVDPGVTYLQIALSDWTTCGITSAGILKCWGDNLNGRVGNGSGGSSSPSSNWTIRTPTIIDAGVTYKDISGNSTNMCGVASTGILKCWGRNSYATLGDGTTTIKDSPTVVDSNVSYSSVKTNSVHSCGLTASGQLKCWGTNYYGQFCNGTAQGLDVFHLPLSLPF